MRTLRWVPQNATSFVELDSVQSSALFFYFFGISSADHLWLSSSTIKCLSCFNMRTFDGLHMKQLSVYFWANPVSKQRFAFLRRKHIPSTLTLSFRQSKNSYSSLGSSLKSSPARCSLNNLAPTCSSCCTQKQHHSHIRSQTIYCLSKYQYHCSDIDREVFVIISILKLNKNEGGQSLRKLLLGMNWEHKSSAVHRGWEIKWISLTPTSTKTCTTELQGWLGRTMLSVQNNQRLWASFEIPAIYRCHQDRSGIWLGSHGYWTVDR